jgi:hypothetical protein
MDKDNQQKDTQPADDKTNKNIQQQRSGFNEQSTKDVKSTVNPEEEANMEQERKDAMTERD